VLQIASLLTFLWFLSLDLYLATALLTDYFPGLVPGYFHLVLYLLCLFGALCPFDILARDTRMYVATTLWHIVTTGWGPVAFRGAWLHTRTRTRTQARAWADGLGWRRGRTGVARPALLCTRTHARTS